MSSYILINKSGITYLGNTTELLTLFIKLLFGVDKLLKLNHIEKGRVLEICQMVFTNSNPNALKDKFQNEILNNSINCQDENFEARLSHLNFYYSFNTWFIAFQKEKL